MLSRLIEWSLSQRLLALAATLALAAAGVHSYLSLPIDAFPDISPTQVKLILKAPGMTPEEVENRVIVPLELGLLGIPRQVMLRSSAKYSIADLTIDFAEGTDIYWARQQVAERYADIQGDLPDGVEGGLAPLATPLSDLFMFTIEGGDLSPQARRTLLDFTLRPALRTIPGVADVNSLGGEVRTLTVVPDREALTRTGLGFTDLVAAIESNNRNDGAGRLADGEEALIVRVEGAVRTAADLRAIVVAERNGSPVRLGDVADVQTEGLTRYGAVTRDGHGEAVEGLVIGLRGANASAVVAGVRERLTELAPSLPAGVEIEVFYDRSELIARAVGTVTKALVEASVLVVILLLLFLGDLRAALVVTLLLPLAALTTFVLMRLFGLTANLMSLGGLAIAIGMLVDAAVVVVENTMTQFQAPGGARLPKLHLVYRATAEVAPPVAAGVIIICLVFLPLLSLSGLEGKLFAPVAKTIVFALSGSLLLSLTVVPVLASYLLAQRAHHEPILVRALEAGYRPVLAAALRAPRTVGSLAAILLGVGTLAYMNVGKTFMPTMDEGDLLVQLEKLPSIGLEESVQSDLRVQRRLLAEIPEIDHIVARIGADELGFDPMGLNQSDVFLQLKPREDWRVPDKAWLADRIREVLEEFPGIDFTFTQPIEMRVAEMLTGSRGDVAVKVFGPDLATLGTLAAGIERTLNAIEGSQDIFTLTNDGVQYFTTRIDRIAAGRAGLSIDDIQDELRAQIEGRRAGTVLIEGRRTPLIVRGAETLREDPAGLAHGSLSSADGTTVPLAQVARLMRSDGPVKVDRENGSRYTVVQANVAGRDLVGYVAEARRRVAESIQLPGGYTVQWGGQFENQQRAAKRLALVVPVALSLIFVVLFMTFGSARQALLILANIPFALVGGILGLWIVGEYMSVPASVGFIALLGIAVLNGLVLVAHFNQLLAAGMDIARVVEEGARRRLRPVMMTAAITALGLVPMLFATGPGSEIQRPLAVVVVGGLFTSTLLTLLLLPVLFRRFALAPGVRS
ncbi:MAG TPA: CusA/CzcA family heavy metal efflux RND transporter [Gammaproteobacteria bacterium]|nr:CusA/CzcA family heavy metal efflux RND transporter [Gammaproteobacteria bacterium]